MPPATHCVCPRCTCEVQVSQIFVRDGQSFCSEACATGHPNHELCHGSGSCGCTCAECGRRVISTPFRSCWPEQHRQPRHSHNNGETPQQDWVHGLQVEPAELSCMQLEQPEGINVLLQQQAVEGAGSSSDQQRCCGDRHQPAMDPPRLSTGCSGALHCLRCCWWSSRSSVQGIQRPLFS